MVQEIGCPFEQVSDCVFVATHQLGFRVSVVLCELVDGDLFDG